MHLENAQKQEMRKQAMDSVLRKKRDDLARREKESVDSGMMAERKKASRKGSNDINRLEMASKIFLDEIKRLAAEGERILEEEQAKYKMAKKQQTEQVRVKLQWDPKIRQYSQKELQNMLGTIAVVISTKKPGRAAAEFERFIECQSYTDIYCIILVLKRPWEQSLHANVYIIVL